MDEQDQVVDQDQVIEQDQVVANTSVNSEHIERSLSKIRVIFEKASAKIEALKSGEKIPATVLAETLAGEIIQSNGEPMKGPLLYPTLKFLFDNYPGVDVKRGAHGGIIKR